MPMVIKLIYRLNCISQIGSTIISHDSESSYDVGHCYYPGCYSRSINYNASMGQLKALAKLSAECHQSIKVSQLII